MIYAIESRESCKKAWIIEECYQTLSEAKKEFRNFVMALREENCRWEVKLVRVVKETLKTYKINNINKHEAT